MTRLAPPPVVFDGRLWPRRELAARAAAWRTRLARQIEPSPAPLGLCMAPHPDTIALFFALASRGAPLILLPPDSRAWRSAPAIPVGTPIVIAPACRPLVSDVPVGLRVVQLDAGAEEGCGVESLPPLTAPGLIFLTSGSTGGAKPVYRTLATLIQQAATLNATISLQKGAGVLAVLPLSGAHGFVQNFLQPTLVGAPIGLLARIDHHSVLDAFASGQYDYVSATPFFASMLTRCALPEGRPRAPSTIRIGGGRLPPAVSTAFTARFGVRLEPQYGTTEHGTIAIRARSDAGDDGAVGRPLAGVAICIGDDPRTPHAPDTPGRVWVRTPWRMEGYGYPPAVEPRADVEDWSPTEDLGMLSATGDLTLVERLGESFKATSGYLVSAERVAEALLAHPDVSDAVVMPVPSASGLLISALVETSADVDADALRRHASRLLPAWMQPHILCVTSALPRLAGGKPDRRQVRQLLEALL